MNLGKLFGTLAIVLVVFLGIKQIQGADGIDVKQAFSMNQQGALLLDVREPEEYSAIHAPNAKLIPLGQLGSRLQEIAAYKDKPVVVICRSGNRSSKAVTMLKEAGYSQVSNVKGGITAWEKDGLAVIKM